MKVSNVIIWAVASQHLQLFAFVDLLSSSADHTFHNTVCASARLINFWVSYNRKALNSSNPPYTAIEASDAPSAVVGGRNHVPTEDAKTTPRPMDNGADHDRNLSDGAHTATADRPASEVQRWNAALAHCLSLTANNTSRHPGRTHEQRAAEETQWRQHGAQHAAVSRPRDLLQANRSGLILDTAHHHAGADHGGQCAEHRLCKCLIDVSNQFPVIISANHVLLVSRTYH